MSPSALREPRQPREAGLLEGQESIEPAGSRLGSTAEWAGPGCQLGARALRTGGREGSSQPRSAVDGRSQFEEPGALFSASASGFFSSSNVLFSLFLVLWRLPSSTTRCSALLSSPAPRCHRVLEYAGNMKAHVGFGLDLLSTDSDVRGRVRGDELNRHARFVALLAVLTRSSRCCVQRK